MSLVILYNCSNSDSGNSTFVLMLAEQYGGRTPPIGRPTIKGEEEGLAKKERHLVLSSVQIHIWTEQRSPTQRRLLRV